MRFPNWISAASLTVYLLLAACSADPAGPEVPSHVGAYCAPSVHSVAIFAGGEWTVSVWFNDSHFQLVPDRDGALHQQEVRECLKAVVIITDAPPDWTAADAIARAGVDLDVTPL